MLRIVFPPEPYADLTLAKQVDLPSDAPDKSEPYVAASDAARLLREELLRYCRGEINGRSFLIGAARGGGKTTLVRSVVQSVEREPTDNSLRPLLISLHGPDLWTPSSRRKDETVKETTTVELVDGSMKETVRTERAPKASRDPSEILLDQIILRTHRAFAWQLSRHYRDRTDEQLKLQTRRSDIRSAELRERSGQLPLNLFQDHPSLAELRSYWRALPRALVDGITPGNFSWRRGAKGTNELQALAGVVDAYRRISGKFERKELQSESSSQDSQQSIGGKSATAEWLPGLLGLAAAGAAGGATVSHLGGPLAALVATLAGLLTFSFSHSTSRAKKHSVEDSFIPDTSSQTLKRVVPVMFNWLREAGYAPVILVDELDKIGVEQSDPKLAAKELTDYFDSIAGQLKDLVAERAIFCFLVNRGQFVVVDEAIKAAPTGIASSFFTYRLMHMIGPTGWSAYLDRLIVPDGSDPLRDAIAARHLTRLFAYQSRLQPLAMQRTLREHVQDGAVRLPGGANIYELSNRRYAIPIAIQVLIEFALTRPAVELWLLRNPNRNQLYLDALYFLAHQWETEQRGWRDPRGKEGRAALADCLKTLGHDMTEQTAVDRKRLDFLCDWSGQLMEWLSSPAIFGDGEFSPWLYGVDPAGYLRDTLASGIPALHFYEDGGGNFRRLYDHAGNTLDDSDIENWAERLDTVVRCRWLLRDLALTFAWPPGKELLEELAVRFRVLDLAPAWPAVSDAMRRLQAMRGRKLDTTNREAAQVVVEYARMLDRASPLVWHVMMCAAMTLRLASEGAQKGRKPDLAMVLDILRQGLRLSERNSVEAREPAQRLYDSYREILGAAAGLPLWNPEEPIMLSTLQHLGTVGQQAWQKLEPGSLAVDANAGWDVVLGRTSKRLMDDGIESPEVSATEILWAACGEGPFRHGLQIDPRSMSLPAWGRMIADSFGGSGGMDGVSLRNIGLHAIGLRLPDDDRFAVLGSLAGIASTEQVDALDAFISQHGLWRGSISCIVLVLMREPRSLFADLLPDTRAAILAVPDSMSNSAILLMARLRSTGLPCFLVREYDAQTVSEETLRKIAAEPTSEGMRQYAAFANWSSTLTLPPNALVGVKDSRTLIDRLFSGG